MEPSLTTAYCRLMCHAARAIRAVAAVPTTPRPRDLPGSLDAPGLSLSTSSAPLSIINTGGQHGRSSAVPCSCVKEQHTSSSLRMLHCFGTTKSTPTAFRMSSAADAHFSKVREATTTRQPREASSVAIALPMPLPPPVTVHDTTRHDTTRHDTTRHDTTRHDTTRHDTTRHTTERLTLASAERNTISSAESRTDRNFVGQQPGTEHTTPHWVGVSA
jgi:hypothetical protein